MGVLVTGGTGLLGSHVARLLRAQGERVVVAGSSARRMWPTSDAERVTLDVTDRAAVFSLVQRVRPAEILHLAARATVAPSWTDAGETLRVNVVGTQHVLDAALACAPMPRVLVAGSSAQLGLVPVEEAPVDESRPCAPIHPYGVSKLAQEKLALAYFAARGLPVVVGRVFNTTGPGESHDAPLRFARRIAELERAGGGELATGELSMLRDLSDPRDMARALVAALRRGAPGEVYHLCSGVARSMREVAESLVAQARAPVRLVRDPAMARVLDEPVIWGNPGKFAAATGHAPRIPFGRTMRDLMAYARGEPVALD